MQLEKLIVNNLKKEFLSRVQKNSKYSLRAFANSLNVDQSYLTKILRGKTHLSQKMIFRLSSALNIKPEILNKNINYEIIKDSTFEIIGNWIYFAIMELIKTTDFRNDVHWISKRLSTHPTEIELAINRLIEVGILTETKDRKLELTKKNLEWNNDIKTSYARKILQKDFLKKAIESIDAVDLDNRENSSLTIAIPKELLPKLKKEIQEFKIKIDRLSEDQESKTEVYQLCIALFPVSRIGENK